MPPVARSVARPARSPLRARAKRRPIGLAALRGFIAAARQLSFTAAAQELALTQSSISRQVAALERQVSQALFLRRTRALALTSAGERLYAAAVAALAGIDRTVDEIRGDSGPAYVTVATYASFASLWLVPRLPDFQRAHPGVDIRIDAGDRLVDLHKEGIDLAIRWLRPGAAIGDAITLADEVTNAAISPRLLAGTQHGARLRAPRDLDRFALLSMDPAATPSRVSSWALWCEFAGIAPIEGVARMYFTYFDQCVQAAVRGQGVALVRTPFLDDLVASGDLVQPFPELRMPTGYRHVLLVNRDRAELPHVASMRDWLVAEFARGPHRLT